MQPNDKNPLNVLQGYVGQIDSRLQQSGKEVELAEINKQVKALEDQMQKIVKTEVRDHVIPDQQPLQWGRKTLKINIPFDILTPENLESIVEKVKPLLVRRHELRRQEAKNLLSLGQIGVNQTVPE